MSRYNSPEVVLRRREGISARRALREIKRREAEERNARTPWERRKARRREASHD